MTITTETVNSQKVLAYVATLKAEKAQIIANFEANSANEIAQVEQLLSNSIFDKTRETVRTIMENEIKAKLVDTTAQDKMLEIFAQFIDVETKEEIVETPIATSAIEIPTV
ncbi:MAG: hypothetical protein RR348_01675 [Clostridia bacterium]